ncbi:glycoside hydrolase family 30 protein [Daedalea quercina L-15889]|uniref:Glycoside hydrolase family 30 protein n=1 Tax=Daedalea quercina L-15889 TaxID=1314783 RepID=A0A165LZJ7_9APHY|nr:glycoside hydrolase family 30 protein [Daedalea quercina L-15889]
MVSCALSVIVSLLSGAYAAQITTTTRQSIHGIGASGAWWVNDIALFPAEVRQNISDLLLNQSWGVGMTDYRYNLGGGGVGVGTWDRAPETPYVSDGVYNWSADAAGTFFLKEAARHGVPIITLFVNSAPTTMTNNSENCGGTLITERIPAYAQYLTDVVSYWKTQGVGITHVSPMNEPDDSFGDPTTTLCSQEGMQVVPEQRAELVITLAATLKAAGLATKVIADESSSTGTYIADAPIWLNTTVGKSLGANAHHQYGFANATLQQQVFEEGRNLSGGVPTWFTEICCYSATDESEASDPLAAIAWGEQYDPTMISGLRMANLIYESFAYAEDEHWDWWTALSNGVGSCTPNNSSCWDDIVADGWDDGIIYYDPNYNETQYYELKLTKRFSVLKHFTKAAPVGSIRRAVTPSTDSAEANWRTLAFDYPASSREHKSYCGPYGECHQTIYSVVAMNAQWNASSLTLRGDDAFALTQPTTVYRTSVTEDYVEVDVPVLGEDGTLVIEAPEMSIYTMFFK